MTLLSFQKAKTVTLVANLWLLNFLGLGEVDYCGATPHIYFLSTQFDDSFCLCYTYIIRLLWTQKKTLSVMKKGMLSQWYECQTQNNNVTDLTYKQYSITSVSYTHL